MPSLPLPLSPSLPPSLLTFKTRKTKAILFSIGDNLILLELLHSLYEVLVICIFFFYKNRTHACIKVMKNIWNLPLRGIIYHYLKSTINELERY